MPVGKRWNKRLRERRVFMQHAVGMTDEEVARNMHLTPKTVRRLLSRVGVAQVVSKRAGRSNSNG